MLIEYLNQNFLSRAQLLEQANLSSNALDRFQERGNVPGPSYRIETVTNGSSFFGPHTEVSEKYEYYSKGCIEWITIARDLHDVDRARSVFDDRYLKELDRVSAQFAPHERERSSRKRLIDDVRLQYDLS